jgi:hypothetical protein
MRGSPNEAERPQTPTAPGHLRCIIACSEGLPNGSSNYASVWSYQCNPIAKVEVENFCLSLFRSSPVSIPNSRSTSRGLTQPLLFSSFLSSRQVVNALEEVLVVEQSVDLRGVECNTSTFRRLEHEALFFSMDIFFFPFTFLM